LVEIVRLVRFGHHASGVDERAARLASDATRTAYAWGFRTAGLLVLLAIPAARTMRRNPAQARAAQAAAAAGGGGPPPRPAGVPEPTPAAPPR
jgi:hypothetical protein